MRRWRDNFCTKKKTEKTVAGVHLYQPPQQDEIECEDCRKRGDESLAGDMVLKFTNEAVRASEQGGDVDIKCTECQLPFKSVKLMRAHRKKFHAKVAVTSKETGEKRDMQSECPLCSRRVLDLTRHLREDCREKKENLMECPHCKNMIPKARFKEHVVGRKSKLTGETLRKGCTENVNICWR